jgi:UDP-2-acetamido-2-deoxy-ribo-hexuluronate aminotransferase
MITGTILGVEEYCAKYNMRISTDAELSFGGGHEDVKVGKLADMTATSFHPSKMLDGFGDGGASFSDNVVR